MSGTAIAGRYAKALFELAQNSKSLDVIEGDFAGLMSAIEASPELRGALNNPVISKENIETVLQQILKKIGANKLTVNFINILVQNGRVKLLEEAISAYHVLMMQSRGEENAYVTTASELNSKQVAEIEKALGAAVGSKIKAVVTVNNEIIGGIIVRIGSKMLDASISGQLEKLALVNKKAIANLN